MASPAQVSPDGFRSFILLTVSYVLLVSALLLLTVSSEIVCFVPPLTLFVDNIVRLATSGAAFADNLEGNRVFSVSDRSFYLQYRAFC